MSARDVRRTERLSRTRHDVAAAIERVNQHLVSAAAGVRRDFSTGIRGLRHDMDAGSAETRAVHDPDFRISIAVSPGIAVGLAGLIAHAARWL
jgi:hypothetical protein